LVYQVPANPLNPPGNNAVSTFLVSRFECNPRISKPITSESMAKAMPVLLQNCSQFAVEYAGDFLTQDNDQYFPPGTPNANQPNPDWGRIKRIGPDGVVDYVVDHSGVTANNYNVSSKIRWYGLPRDTNGDRIIPGFAASPGFPRALYKTGQPYSGATNANELVDVVPLSDVIATFDPTWGAASFERELPLPAPGGDYGLGMINANANAKAAFRYTCVWVNSAPTMIRLVVKLEDPAGRLPEGQWFEYVVGAP